MTFSSQFLPSQTITNVQVRQEGLEIIITYDMAGELQGKEEIMIGVSTDGGKNYTSISNAERDVGKNVKPGTGKEITCLVNDALAGKNASFKVFVYDYHNLELIERNGIWYSTIFDEPYTGIWTIWYSNGQKKEEIMLINGKKWGIWTEWYENGVIKYKDVYIKKRGDDRQFFIFSGYNQSGELFEHAGSWDKFEIKSGECYYDGQLVDCYYNEF